jgi:hypothetical protein
MIAAVLLGVGTAALIAWILLPLFRRTASVAHTEQPLQEAKGAVYQSILDLEFDHRLGKVSDEDYGILRGQHEREAIEILHQLDADPDDLEAEIAAARERLRRG